MPYLKDCIVYDIRWTNTRHDVPFVHAHERGFSMFDKEGRIKNALPVHYHISVNGTAISDRDYRLSIARAKALQNNQK